MSLAERCVEFGSQGASWGSEKLLEAHDRGRGDSLIFRRTLRLLVFWIFAVPVALIAIEAKAASDEPIASIIGRAEAGEVAAQYDVGRAYWDGTHGLPVSYYEAFEWMHRAARGGHLDAKYRLGFMYDKALGVKENVNAAHVYYLAAAREGHPAATYHLAQLYLMKMTSMSQQARMENWFTWMKKAADVGVQDAYKPLARAYLDGFDGTSKDVNEAVRLYERCAPFDNWCASNLGSLYLKGNKLPRDDTKALYWFQYAARRGHTTSKLDLAKLYEAGDGVRKDDEAALYWYEAAAADGNDYAKNKAREIKQRTGRSSMTAREAGELIGALLRLYADNAASRSGPAAQAPGSASNSGTAASQQCYSAVSDRIVRCETSLGPCNAVGCDYEWACYPGRKKKCRYDSKYTYYSGRFFCDPENGEKFDTERDVYQNSCQ